MDKSSAHEHSEHESQSPNPRTKWVLIGFFAIAAFFLFTEHRAHLFGILPFLLLLVCPLLHLFHHGGHGGHGGDSQDKSEGENK